MRWAVLHPSCPRWPSRRRVRSPRPRCAARIRRARSAVPSPGCWAWPTWPPAAAPSWPPWPECSLFLLAGLGYDGGGLTLDQRHLDPYAPDLQPRLGRLARRLAELGLDVVIGTGGRFDRKS